MLLKTVKLLMLKSLLSVECFNEEQVLSAYRAIVQMILKSQQFPQNVVTLSRNRDARIEEQLLCFSSCNHQDFIFFYLRLFETGFLLNLLLTSVILLKLKKLIFLLCFVYPLLK